MFERFTDRARRAVVTAQEEAAKLQHHSVGPEHLLLALLRLQSGVAFAVLTEAGIDYDRALAAAIEQAEPGGARGAAAAGPAEALAAIGIDLGQIRRSAEQNFGPGALQFPRLTFSPAAKRILPLASREALALGHFHVGTEHLLLGLLADDAAGVLDALGADAGEVRSMVVHRTAPWAERMEAANAGITRLTVTLFGRLGHDRPQAQDMLHRLRDQTGDAYREAARRSQEAQQHLADELERVLTAAAAEYPAAGGTPPAAGPGSAEQ